MKDFLKYTGWILLFMSSSRVLHAISQIRDHGKETCLPDWIVSDKDWFSFSSVLDGYHVVKDLSFELYGVAFLVIFAVHSHTTKTWKVVLAAVVAWLLSWQVFNLFYHVIWRL